MYISNEQKDTTIIGAALCYLYFYLSLHILVPQSTAMSSGICFSLGLRKEAVMAALPNTSLINYYFAAALSCFIVV